VLNTFFRAYYTYSLPRNAVYAFYHVEDHGFESRSTQFVFFSYKLKITLMGPALLLPVYSKGQVFHIPIVFIVRHREYGPATIRTWEKKLAHSNQQGGFYGDHSESHVV